MLFHASGNHHLKVHYQELRPNPFWVILLYFFLQIFFFNDWDLEKIGTFANAAGALVATRLTCADAMPTVAELEKMLAGAA